MTRDEEIQITRKLLKVAQSVRDTTDAAEGPEKVQLLAMADAAIAKAKMNLAVLEHPAAPLSAAIPLPEGVQ